MRDLVSKALPEYYYHEAAVDLGYLDRMDGIFGAGRDGVAVLITGVMCSARMDRPDPN